MLIIKRILISTSLLLTASTLALACPPKAGETELTFPRIMQNFGRLTIKADTLVREMNRDGASKEDPTLAANDLATAVSCAQIAVTAAANAVAELAAGQELSAETARLTPGGLEKCTPETKAKYLEHYHQSMVAFEKLLAMYQADVVAQDFLNALISSKKVQKMADQSHDQLNPSMFCSSVLAQ